MPATSQVTSTSASHGVRRPRPSWRVRSHTTRRLSNVNPATTHIQPLSEISTVAGAPRPAAWLGCTASWTTSRAVTAERDHPEDAAAQVGR